MQSQQISSVSSERKPHPAAQGSNPLLFSIPSNPRLLWKVLEEKNLVIYLSILKKHYCPWLNTQFCRRMQRKVYSTDYIIIPTILCSPVFAQAQLEITFLFDLFDFCPNWDCCSLSNTVKVKGVVSAHVTSCCKNCVPFVF